MVFSVFEPPAGARLARAPYDRLVRYVPAGGRRDGAAAATDGCNSRFIWGVLSRLALHAQAMAAGLATTHLPQCVTGAAAAHRRPHHIDYW